MDKQESSHPHQLSGDALKVLSKLGLETAGLVGRTVNLTVALTQKGESDPYFTAAKTITCPHCPSAILTGLQTLADRRDLTVETLTDQDKQLLQATNIWQAHRLSEFRENISIMMEHCNAEAKSATAVKQAYAGNMGGIPF